jgi:hypothetical protein
VPSPCHSGRCAWRDPRSPSFDRASAQCHVEAVLGWLGELRLTRAEQRIGQRLRLVSRTTLGAATAPAAPPTTAPTGPATTAPVPAPTAAPPIRCSVVLHAPTTSADAAIRPIRAYFMTQPLPIRRGEDTASNDHLRWMVPSAAMLVGLDFRSGGR